MFDRHKIDDWVDYIQTLHAREIELSLERVREVYQRLCPNGMRAKIISIAGTNGKGSTSELIASIYRAGGFKTGKFTSPHLVRFNERYSINGSDVDDSDLLVAFRQVESARRETPITYFEFGFLLSVALFETAEVDVAIMEVGLGGRLDAVNILDADVAIITSISLDHTAWLGDTLEAIAYEKAGISRPGKPCIVGVRRPQKSMLAHFKGIDALPSLIGRDFDYSECSDNSTWSFSSGSLSFREIELPYSQSGVQLSNASLAIQATTELQSVLPVSDEAVYQGTSRARLAGRCQLISDTPLIVLDVSHNEASLGCLAEFIADQDYTGSLIALCGMLKDKEVGASLAKLAPIVDLWHFADINNERGATAQYLKECLLECGQDAAQKTSQLHENVQQAYQSARKTLTDNDCLVVFGSFYVAGDIISMLGNANCGDGL